MTTQIVVVEDEPIDVEAVRRAFADHRVTNRLQVFGTGEEALDYLLARGPWSGLADGAPHLVLLDLKLPGISGLGVLAELRADPRTRRIPIVLMSGASDRDAVARGYELGANSFIVKPVDFTGFAQAVRTVGLYWSVLNEPPSS